MAGALCSLRPGLPREDKTSSHIRTSNVCSYQIVVEKKSPALIPKILNHSLASFGCFAFPILGIFRMAEKDAHPLQVRFRLVKQTVQADRGKMMGSAPKGPNRNVTSKPDSRMLRSPL